MEQSVLIRQGNIDDLHDLQHLFADTVMAICCAHYNNRQIEAWIYDTRHRRDTARWAGIMSEQTVYVACLQTKIVGFATVANNCFIDMLYVHKDHQRQGVGRYLYKEIESDAQKKRVSTMTVDASITALPFFERQGFTIIESQKVEKHGVVLSNFRMEKKL